MNIRVLGPLEVEAGGESLPLGGPGERKVFALLTLYANRVLSTDRLINELWGDEPPQTARNIVQRYISNLRRSMGEAGKKITTRSPGYLLRVADDELDSALFERLVAEAQAAEDPGEAASKLGTALDLWRGRPFEDIEPTNSTEAEAARLIELHLSAVEARIDADLALGKDAALVGELEGLVHLHPLRERFRGQLMLALYRAGRQSDALRSYQEARRTLGEELGIEPGEDLQELEDRVLRHDRKLLLPVAPRSIPPAPLPAGAVTFLFTDIESSTAHWERDAEWMKQAEETSHRLVAAAVDLHHGVVFKIVGDGMCAAFESVSGALAAAVAAQLALGEEDWEAGEGLRIRMAVHTGTAFPTDGDYLGPPLNRCARLLDAGHGGQILLSSTSAGLARAEPLEGAELVNMGRFHLPGLSNPEEIHQLVSERLPGKFPALRVPPVSRSNLPAQTSKFIGRTEALAHLESILAETRLLTLVGAGGAGKTRLALELGTREVEHYPDGVWLVELAPIVDSELIIAAIAESLGVARRPTETLTVSVMEHLRTRRTLVILDNCEHVVDAIAEWVDAALRSAPNLTLLATSRTGLGVDGEHRWQVPPLGLPPIGASIEQLLDSEAVRLFADRAAQVRVGFSIDSDNVATVARICRDLDGMPLAIELGAARVKTLSVHDLAERVGDRFALLTGGNRTALSRHKTLRAVVEWSYELLNEPERQLFAALSVFAGGFNLAGAEAVGGPDLDTLNVLDSLIDQSLVTAEIRNRSEARYRMLETLRQYGDEVLADRETVAARHSGFYLELAEEGARRLRMESDWYERLDRELDNLRKAIGWTLGPGGQAETAARCAVALREFWQVRGHWREAQHWLDLCLEQADQLPTRLVGQLHHAAGVTSALRRDYDRAFPHLEAALELFRQSGRPADVADALFDLSQAAARHGDYARAETLLSESRALYEKDGNQTGLAEACCVLAQVAVFRGDREEAGIQGREARRRFRELGDQYGEAWILSVMGESAFSHGDLEEAADLFQSAATLADEIHIPQFVANGLQGLGDVESARGHQRKARRFLNESLRINREIGDTLFVAGVFASLAAVAARQNEYRQAARLWGLEGRLREELGGMPSRRRGGRYDGDFEELQGLAREALGEGRFAAALAEGAGMTVDEAAATYGLRDP